MTGMLDRFISGLGRAVWFLKPGLTRFGPQYRPRPVPELNRAPCIPYPPDGPSISIALPSLNQGAYLGHCLESIMAQRCPSLEILVKDGGSTDGTKEVLHDYASSLTWCASEPDRGQVFALNRAFSQSTGELMAWLNADDAYLPGALPRVGTFFARHPEVDVVYAHRILVNETGEEIGRWILPRHGAHLLRWVDFVPQETLFWRRRIWEKTGARLDESFSFAMDWELLLRFSAAGARIVRLPFFPALFRVHPAQKTSALMEKVGKREMQRLRRRYLGYTPSLRAAALRTAPSMLFFRFIELLWKARLLRYD